MALDLKLRNISNLRGKADRFVRLVFRGMFKVDLEGEKVLLVDALDQQLKTLKKDVNGKSLGASAK